MNTLCQEKKIQILNALTEGCSIHRIERMTGVHRDTIMRLGVEVGSRCAQSLDQKLTDLSVEEAEIDEIWCYVGKKQKHVTALDNEREGGDQYTLCCHGCQNQACSLLPGRKAHWGECGSINAGPTVSRKKPYTDYDRRFSTVH